MDRERHPKVVRTWMAGKIRMAAEAWKRIRPAGRKPVPHNKT
jgi:hypothetical protein